MSKIAIYLLSGIAVAAIAGVAVYMFVLAPRTPSKPAPTQPGAPTATVPGKPAEVKKEEPKGGTLGNYKVDFESTITHRAIAEPIVATSVVNASATLSPVNGKLSGSGTLNYVSYKIESPEEGDGCVITERFANSTFYVRSATLSENMDDVEMVIDFDDPLEEVNLHCEIGGYVVDRTLPMQGFTGGFSMHHETERTAGNDGWLLGTGWVKGSGDVLATWSVNRTNKFEPEHTIQEQTTIAVRAAK